MAEENKKESPAEEKSAPKEKKEVAAAVEVPEKFKKLVQQIEELSVLELAELVKVLEEKFGVSPMTMAAAPAVGGAPTARRKSLAGFCRMPRRRARRPR